MLETSFIAHKRIHLQYLARNKKSVIRHLLCSSTYSFSDKKWDQTFDEMNFNLKSIHVEIAPFLVSEKIYLCLWLDLYIYLSEVQVYCPCWSLSAEHTLISALRVALLALVHCFGQHSKHYRNRQTQPHFTFHTRKQISTSQPQHTR